MVHVRRSGFALADLETGERREAEVTGRVVARATTPDGRRALVAAPALALWDLEALALVRRYEDAPPVVGAVGISADGKLGAVLHADRKLRLWSLAGSWAVAAADASGIEVPSVMAFDPRGEWLLVGSSEGRFHRFAMPRSR